MLPDLARQIEAGSLSHQQRKTSIVNAYGVTDENKAGGQDCCTNIVDVSGKLWVRLRPSCDMIELYGNSMHESKISCVR